MEEKPKVLAVSLVDQITEVLRREILRGDISPEQRILVHDLQTRLQVSHIPIREALRRLESEGLVRTAPNRGAVAAAMSLSEAVELFDFRRLLEGALAERSVPYTSEHQKALEQALEELDLRAQLPLSDDYFSAHKRFHWLILSPGATALIKRTLRHLWQMSERYTRLSIRGAVNRANACGWHRDLYHASITGNPTRLKQEIVRHYILAEEDVRFAWRDITTAQDVDFEADGAVLGRAE